jgi:integrase
MAKTLTAVSVENAKPRKNPTTGKLMRAEIPDGGCAGLHLVVQPTGAKSWAVRYRFGGKTRKLTLGPVLAHEVGKSEPDDDPTIDRPLTLADARMLATNKLRKAEQGDTDPAIEKRRLKADRRKGVSVDVTIESVAERFIERYAKRNTRETTWRETARILGFKPDPEDPQKLVRSTSGGEVLAKWKGRSIHAIKRADVIELLDGIVDRGSPITANRVLAAVRKMFAWAASRDMIGASPCVGVKPPASETARDRVLTDDELRTIWQACDKIGWPFGPMVKLLMLTAQRRDEVAEMRWSEIDIDARAWTLTRERVKNDQAHVVPLSDAAINVLASLPHVKGKSDFVFTTTGDSPIAGFSRAKDRLDDATTEANLPPLEHWTFHDLRRTAATGMARLGIDLPVIERVLNHTSGSFGGIVGVYQKHNFADKQRSALQAWGRFIGNLMTPAPANVVPFRG